MKNTTTDLEIVSQEDAKLIEYAGKTGLETSSTTPLVEAFRPIFTEARAVLSQAIGVAESVKDATCVSEIKKARACRLAIRKVRISGEAIRKSQKATALAYGKAVDGFYNILEADLAPVEKALLDAEETAERAETARKDALEEGRKSALSPYVDDASLYAVRDMSEPAFVALLAGVKLAKEQAEAAAKQAEADRIAKEQAEAAERERVIGVFERLRKEAFEQAKAQEEERAKAAQAAEKARLEREAIELKARAEQAKEREAPDREKIKAFSASVRALAIPIVKSPEALAVVATIQQQIEKFAKWADDKAESL